MKNSEDTKRGQTISSATLSDGRADILATIRAGDRLLEASLRCGIDISIPVSSNGVRAFSIDRPAVHSIEAEGFVGDVNKGGSCNCCSISFNPHGNGTHTECIGHLDERHSTILSCLRDTHVLARLVTIRPRKLDNGDWVIGAAEIKEALRDCGAPEALVIRTTPNDENKRTRDYSGTNPPYFLEEALAHLAAIGIRHLVVDLPSVDREDDGGKLLGHRAFWNYPATSRRECTITELVFIPDNVACGEYLLNLQVTGFESDASPSRPILYPLSEISA